MNKKLLALLMGALTVINPLLLVAVAVYDLVRYPSRTWKLIVGPPNIFVRLARYPLRYFPGRQHADASEFWGWIGAAVWG